MEDKKFYDNVTEICEIILKNAAKLSFDVGLLNETLLEVDRRTNQSGLKVCPLCGLRYSEYPASSRVCDLDICGNCGTREALVKQTKEGFLELWDGAKGLTMYGRKKVIEQIEERLKNR